ncbi:MAG: hypothetical protein KatS3mg076_0762 [Candidatus Binatia bacterium]|nr:MAG: hypothetical protein KatS3mg076_0762 [Candidatus Binatia bacterium]
MNRLALAGTVGLLSGLLACATVPYTQRSQLLLVPESQEVSLGTQLFREVLREANLSDDPRALEVVRRVGSRIAAVSERPDYEWEFAVIDDPGTANAFALPGGKVAVYTGLFPVARDEAGLAAVIGHEVAHVLARHAGERLSQDLLLQIGATGLAVALGDMSPASRNALMQAFGLGVQFGVVLPFSRSQESEADHIGLILMAKAGYDPEAALGLWERMEETSKAAPPEFLSTHPSYGTRREQIRRWLPEAGRYYASAPKADVAPLPQPEGWERGREHAALETRARWIDGHVRGPQGKAVRRALARMLGESPEAIESKLEARGVSWGRYTVAAALARARGVSTDAVLDAFAREGSWSAAAAGDEESVAAALRWLDEATRRLRALSARVPTRRTTEFARPISPSP